MTLRDGWLHRTAKALVPSGWRPTAVLTRAVVRKTGQTVASGPFRGMKYVSTGVGSAYYPKLLGVYERELHPAIAAIRELRPDRIIDIGAAEGYYAVGLAMNNPAAIVTAFEQEPDGQGLVRAMAARNGVADRVRVLGRCEPADLQAELAAAHKPVVVCDVEGYESTLLDPATVPGLATAWVLVELHEFIVAGVGDLIQGRFAKTHKMTEIVQTDRSRADLPFLRWYARLLPTAYATYPVNEFRPARMSWLWMEPLSAPGGRVTISGDIAASGNPLPVERSETGMSNQVSNPEGGAAMSASTAATALSWEEFCRILRCPSHLPGGRTCLGRLAETAGGLRCDGCGTNYSVVHGVPVLRPRSDTETDQWFETMYDGRGRTEDVENNYLAAGRREVAELVSRFGVRGPSLDVGSGTGVFAGTVPGYVALEYALQALLNPGMDGIPRVCADAARLPFADCSFQLVFSYSTLEHVPEVGRAFTEMDRVLAPGGLLVLEPAWHCPRYQTELIPILPYSALNPRQKIVKALLPILRTRACKLCRRLPVRVWRRLTCGPDAPLGWRRLMPAHHEYVIPDQDAVADLDCHEGIWFYVRRGYRCLSHPAVWRQLLAGHDTVVLRKPPAPTVR